MKKYIPMTRVKDSQGFFRAWLMKYSPITKVEREPRCLGIFHTMVYGQGLVAIPLIVVISK
jgi:hypothetical protein